jgi:histidine triad (HIT) family protein
MEPSIFSKIISGDIPCHKVYEDVHTFAFMDIKPIQPGMVVVVSKEQIDNFEDLPDDLFCAVMLTSKKIMHALRKTFPEKKKIAVKIEGLEVAHAHTTVLPIDSGDDFAAKPPVGGPDHAALEKLANEIKGYIV